MALKLNRIYIIGRLRFYDQQRIGLSIFGRVKINHKLYFKIYLYFVFLMMALGLLTITEMTTNLNLKKNYSEVNFFLL